MLGKAGVKFVIIYSVALIRRIFIPLLRMKFYKYGGALVMRRSTFDWNILILFVLDFSTEPHS